MKHAALLFLFALIVVSCQSSGEQVVSSPDKKLRIFFIEEAGWPSPRVAEWTNAIRYYSDGRWQVDSSRTLSFEYYCDDAAALKDRYDELQKWDYSEWKMGFQPIRIDQIVLTDGTPIYLVYAMTYADTAYHDYYYTYTALCIKDGKLHRYPVFKSLVGCKELESDIINVTPVSIDLDYTHPQPDYMLGLDCKITEAYDEDRIWFDANDQTLVIADVLCFRFINDTFTSNTF